MMKTRFILTLIIFSFFSSVASAAPYYRFWRGWKLDAVSYEKNTIDAEKEVSSPVNLLDALNNKFISETINVGAEKGLRAYLPALLPLPKDRPVELSRVIPDEIALVVYDSETHYKYNRSTPEGKAYGGLHWEYFDKAKGSSSLVPEVYSGVLDVNHAYDILQSNSDWQEEGRSAVVLFSEKLGDPKSYVNKMKDEYSKKGLLSYLILVADRYVIEYQLWNDAKTYKDIKAELEKERKDVLRPLEKMEPALRYSANNTAPGIKYGEGINRQFYLCDNILFNHDFGHTGTKQLSLDINIGSSSQTIVFELKCIPNSEDEGEMPEEVAKIVTGTGFVSSHDSENPASVSKIEFNSGFDDMVGTIWPTLKVVIDNNAQDEKNKIRTTYIFDWIERFWKDERYGKEYFLFNATKSIYKSKSGKWKIQPGMKDLPVDINYKTSKAIYEKNIDVNKELVEFNLVTPKLIEQGSEKSFMEAATHEWIDYIGYDMGEYDCEAKENSYGDWSGSCSGTYGSTPWGGEYVAKGSFNCEYKFMWNFGYSEVLEENCTKDE